MNGSFHQVRRARGFSLVELMVALAVGLIVTGAAITVFLSTSRTYDATESLGRVQENLRVAFELMARDIREAGGNPCERGLPVYNVLNNPQGKWYTDAVGIRGYEGTQAFVGEPFGTGTAQRIAGTDAIEIKSAGPGMSIVSHVPTSAQFKLGTADHGLSPGDIAMACDFGEVAVFQVTNAQPGINATVVHNPGTGTPGNCSKGLGYSAPPNCDGANGNQYAFGCYMGKFSGGGCDGDEDGTKNEPEDLWPAIVSRLRMERWYIGANAQGGKSLYQSSVRNDGGKLKVDNNEIVDGVENMSLKYLLVGATGYVDATAVSAADWASGKVVAVAIDIVLTGAGTPGADGKDIQRHLKMITTIRNHTE